MIVSLYIIAALAEFIAPFDPNSTNARFTYAPPQGLHLFHEGKFAPNVSRLSMTLNKESLRREFKPDPDKSVFLGLFVPAKPYKLLGVVPMETKLFGIKNPKIGDSLYLFGADRLGRDILSRVLYGAQISLSIGLVGVVVSLVLGVAIGGISGFFWRLGRCVDPAFY